MRIRSRDTSITWDKRVVSSSRPVRRRAMSRLLALGLVLGVLIGFLVLYFGLFSSGFSDSSFLRSNPFGEVVVSGTVVDGLTGMPIPGATVTVVEKGSEGDQASAAAQADGSFTIKGLSRVSQVAVAADGYENLAFPVQGSGNFDLKLQPVVLSGVVRDSRTRSPIEGAAVSLADVKTVTDAEGRYRLVGARQGNSLSVRADGFANGEAKYNGEGELDLSLRPNTLSGLIADAGTGKPVKDARASVGEVMATTGEDGVYRLANLPPSPFTMTVTAPGYDRISAEVGDVITKDVRLKPFSAKGLYLTYYGVADDGLRSNALGLIDKTEANAVVIDIKGDRGWLAYKSEVPMVARIGAQQTITIKDIDGLLATLKKKGIYTIARIVVFKDNPLATARSDLAVIDTRTGKPWIDRENLAWVDPFQQEVWNYDIALAKEAARKGFDEIQFDYIRFPTDGSVSTAKYARPNTEENRLRAISEFLARARSELKPLNANLSVDVFGYTCWRDDDMGIGQKLEEMAKYVDFISPMVYPSTFSDGIPGYKDAVAHPYEIVYYSLKKAVERLQGSKARIRPWLQYFDDYPWATGKSYNAQEILAQKKAAADAGASGWLMWDPANKYARGGFAAP